MPTHARNEDSTNREWVMVTGRRLAALGGCFGLVLAGSLSSLEASDRKSVTRREMANVSSIAQITQPAVVRAELSGASASPERRAATGPVPELKPVTLFRFNSRFGEVAVQPVFGTVKGAQLSLGF